VARCVAPCPTLETRAGPTSCIVSRRNPAAWVESKAAKTLAVWTANGRSLSQVRFSLLVGPRRLERGQHDGMGETGTELAGLFGERAGSISRVTRRFTGHRGRPIKPEACSPDMCKMDPVKRQRICFFFQLIRASLLGGRPLRAGMCRPLRAATGSLFENFQQLD
jgi:hypothetical protein